MNSKQHATTVRISPWDYYCGFCARQHATLQCPNIAFTLRDLITEQITYYLRTDPKGFVPAYMRLKVICTPVYTYEYMLEKALDYLSAGREEELATEFMQISKIERKNALEERNSRGEILINCSFCAQKHAENRCPVIAYVNKETHNFYLSAEPKGQVPDTVFSLGSEQDELDVPDVAEDAQPEDAEPKQQDTDEMEDKVLFGIELALRLQLWQDLDLDEA